MGHFRPRKLIQETWNKSVKFWDRWGPIRNPLKVAKWWIFHRFHPKHRYNILHTGLPPGYYDPKEQILHTTMESVRQFVEQTDGTIDWEWREDHKQAYKQLIEVYHWWVYEYPAFEAASDQLHERWVECIEHKDPQLTNDELFKTPLTTNPEIEDIEQQLLEQIQKLEVRQTDESRAMLIKVANVLEYLWYP